MAFYITLDEQGNEVSRKPVGRGRPPKGFVKQPSGDFIMTAEPKPFVIETPIGQAVLIDPVQQPANA